MRPMVLQRRISQPANPPPTRGHHWEAIRAPAANGSWLLILFEVTDDRKHQLRTPEPSPPQSESSPSGPVDGGGTQCRRATAAAGGEDRPACRAGLNFDNFEIRLLDPRTRQLELVIAENINPLKIGEVIYAEPEGNGISAGRRDRQRLSLRQRAGRSDVPRRT